MGANKGFYNIATINRYEKRSGAAFIARSVFSGIRDAGHSSKFIVQHKSSEDSDVWEINGVTLQGIFQTRLNQWLQSIPAENNTMAQKYLRKAVRTIMDPVEAVNYLSGRENTHYRGAVNCINHSNISFDLLHMHNLHDGYFGIDTLPKLSERFPLVLTMHDTWMLSGHCAYAIECDRWINGCGNCPDLSRYPSLLRDGTAKNWKHKADIYKKSRIYPVGVSQWVLDQAQKSMLAPAIRLPSVIYNGIDLTVFKPGEKLKAREKLGLLPDQNIVLFVANSLSQSTYKDLLTFQETWKHVGGNWKQKQPILFLGIGGNKRLSQTCPGAELLILEKIKDINTVASYYRAADIYLHTTRADTFPTTILEAMACGLPVIATRVGGIPEQVIEKETGHLANFQDGSDHGRLILNLLEDPETVLKMGERAAQVAVQKYNQDRMISEYLSYYEEVIDDWKR